MRTDKIIRWVIWTMVVGLLSGCSALNQDARINFLEGQMKDVLQKSAEWDVTSKDVRTKIADYGAQMDTLRDQLQVLTGQVEEMEAGSMPKENPIFAQQAAPEEVRRLKERLQSLEARVTELEQGLSPDDPSVVGEPPKKEKPVKAVTPPVVKAKKEPSIPEDKKQYDGAIAAMKQKQYEKAIRIFRTLIKKHPKSNLRDNAQYWIGECYYAQKKYEEAIIEFEEVVQQYPKGDKVPAALLKEGLAFHELKDNTPARQILKKLIDQFPDSEEARKAEDKLKGF